MAQSKTAHKIDTKARTIDILSENKVDFAGLLLSDSVLRGLQEAGFEQPSPIQLKTIPLGRCGLDLIVQAKSGTGKTCVFSVVALESICCETNALQVLILAPTREISVQIWEVIKSIGSAIAGLRCYTFIGGLPLKDDLPKLRKCHIGIGTPGRVKQLIELGHMNTDSIRLFVLDEADKLMDSSFQETINWIYSSLSETKQMLAVSATYPEVLAQHLTAYMRNPTFVRLNTSDPALIGIRQYYKALPFHPMPQKVFDIKVKHLTELLTLVSFNQCLVFSNYQIRAESLSQKLNSKGWPSTFISGSQDQHHRLTAMAKLKKFKCRVLVSTDLTARGIDAENVNLVINIDIPGDHETYLHRIGRAGRFGSYGAAVSFACDGKEVEELMKIEEKCNTTILALPEPVPEELASSSGFIDLDKYITTEKIITQSSANVGCQGDEKYSDTYSFGASDLHPIESACDNSDLKHDVNDKQTTEKEKAAVKMSFATNLTGEYQSSDIGPLNERQNQSNEDQVKYDTLPVVHSESDSNATSCDGVDGYVASANTEYQACSIKTIKKGNLNNPKPQNRQNNKPRPFSFQDALFGVEKDVIKPKTRKVLEVTEKVNRETSKHMGIGRCNVEWKKLWYCADLPAMIFSFPDLQEMYTSTRQPKRGSKNTDHSWFPLSPDEEKLFVTEIELLHNHFVTEKAKLSLDQGNTSEVPVCDSFTMSDGALPVDSKQLNLDVKSNLPQVVHIDEKVSLVSDVKDMVCRNSSRDDSRSPKGSMSQLPHSRKTTFCQPENTRPSEEFAASLRVQTSEESELESDSDLSCAESEETLSDNTSDVTSSVIQGSHYNQCMDEESTINNSYLLSNEEVNKIQGIGLSYNSLHHKHKLRRHRSHKLTSHSSSMVTSDRGHEWWRGSEQSAVYAAFYYQQSELHIQQALYYQSAYHSAVCQQQFSEVLHHQRKFIQAWMKTGKKLMRQT